VEKSMESQLPASPEILRARPEPPASSGVPRRILAVKVHGLGDAVMIRMLLERLKSRHPGLQIGVLAGPSTREVMTLGGEFSLHAYDPKRRGAFNAAMLWLEIRHRRYDAVLNFEQVSLSGTRFLRTTGIPVRIGFVPLSHIGKQSLLTHAVRFVESESMWHAFIRLVQTLDNRFPAAVEPVALPVSDEAKNRAAGRIFDHCGLVDRLIALHLGPASGPYRRWPAKRFAELAIRLSAGGKSLGVVLTGLPEEKHLCVEFQQAYRGRVVDATDAGSLEMTAALLANCHLLVSNDTGIMHLGAGIGVPTVGIFGPDIPGRYAPVGRLTASVYAGAKCSPCVNIYRAKSPLTCVNAVASQCLKAISVEDVARAAERLMSEG
jgi:heptosyltransferase-2